MRIQAVKKGNHLRALVVASVCLILAVAVPHGDVWLDTNADDAKTFALEEAATLIPSGPIFLGANVSPQPRIEHPLKRLAGQSIRPTELVFLLPGHSFADLSPPQ